MAEPDGRVLQLSESQRTMLQSFQEIANINDEYLCMQILQQNNWDLSSALGQFVGNTNNESASSSSRSEGSVTRRTNRTTETVTSQQRVHTPSSSSVVNNASDRHNRDNEGTGGLLGLLIVPLRWLFQARPLSLNPDQDTQKFIDEYNMKYSPTHPTFHAGSYQSAVAHAFEQSKFLLVYLHSPLHEDSQRFCRGVLAAPAVVTYANQNLVTWTGRVWDPEAYGLSTQLRASSFPFVALLVCQSNRTVQIADRIQGYVEENVLMERIQNSVNAFTNVVAQNRQEAHRRYTLLCFPSVCCARISAPLTHFLFYSLPYREEAIRLRAQQDREYRESAEADRLATLRQQEETAQRLAQEEEARQQAELAAAVEMSRQLTAQDTLRKLREVFAASPEPDASPVVSAVRFQLPSGKKISRRFTKTDTVQVLYMCDVTLVCLFLDPYVQWAV